MVAAQTPIERASATMASKILVPRNGAQEDSQLVGSAYTPGLTVSADVVVRRTRRLPIKGEVFVKTGDKVEPHQVIAQAMLPGILQTIKLADKMGMEPKDVVEFVKVKPGDPVTKGTLVAEGKKMFGIFKAPTVESEYEGTVESVSDITGNLLVREPSIPVSIDAYLKGSVVDVLPEEGAVIETRGAMVQGIFGVGGERLGTIEVRATEPDQILEADMIHDSDAGKILVGGAGFTYSALEKAANSGVVGLVAGGVRDQDLKEFLGYEIGVAITGTEAIPLSILVTEGFGYLPMAMRTFELLKALQGKVASMNGATQIRAGVIRPELVVPNEAASGQAPVQQSGGELKEGTPIRIIREPYFGLLGTVTALPAHLVVLESGTEVRVLRAKLSDGQEVTVPRANVEIIATGS